MKLLVSLLALLVSIQSSCPLVFSHISKANTFSMGPCCEEEMAKNAHPVCEHCITTYDNNREDNGLIFTPNIVLETVLTYFYPEAFSTAQQPEKIISPPWYQKVFLEQKMTVVLLA